MRRERSLFTVCFPVLCLVWLVLPGRLMAEAHLEPGEKPLLREYYVNHFKAFSNKPAPAFKLMVRQSPVDTWRVLEHPVEGFDYRWGFVYRLRVAVESGGDADEPHLRLVRVLAADPVPVGTAFILSGWSGISDPLGLSLAIRGKNQFCLLDELTFVADPALAGQLAALDATSGDVVLHFRHGEDGTAKVVGMTLNGTLVPTLSAWALALLACGLVLGMVVFQTRRRRFAYCSH